MSRAKTWCDACVVDDDGRPVAAAPSYGVKVAPDVAESMSLLAKDFRLCRMCKGLIQAGREQYLREQAGLAIIKHHPDHREQTAILAHSEIAITLASWTFRPFKHAATSPGFRLFNALLRTFPRAVLADGTPGSILERDLGGNVMGTFTIFQGVLLFENLISRDRGKGNAARALAAVCAIADAEASPIAGYVQANESLGLAPGLDVEALHAWYARFGFIRGTKDPNNVVRPAGADVLVRPV